MQLNVYNCGLQSTYLVLAIQIGFTFLVPAYPDCPGKEADKWLLLPGLSNYTYNERLSFLNIPSLEQRRMRADLILCYKMSFGHLNICSVDFLKLNHQA